MDDIFIKVANILNKIKNDGLIELNLKICDDVALNLINPIVEVLKQGYSSEYFNFEVDYRVQQCININNLDDDVLKKIFVVKHLSIMIFNNDEDAMLSFSRYFCKQETYDIMLIILGLVEIDSSHSAVMKLVDIANSTKKKYIAE